MADRYFISASRRARYRYNAEMSFITSPSGVSTRNVMPLAVTGFSRSYSDPSTMAQTRRGRVYHSDKPYKEDSITINGVFYSESEKASYARFIRLWYETLFASSTPDQIRFVLTPSDAGKSRYFNIINGVEYDHRSIVTLEYILAPEQVDVGVERFVFAPEWSYQFKVIRKVGRDTETSRLSGLWSGSYWWNNPKTGGFVSIPFDRNEPKIVTYDGVATAVSYEDAFGNGDYDGDGVADRLSGIEPDGPPTGTTTTLPVGGGAD